MKKQLNQLTETEMMETNGGIILTELALLAAVGNAIIAYEKLRRILGLNKRPMKGML